MTIVALSCVRDEVALLALASSGNDGVDKSLLVVSIVDCTSGSVVVLGVGYSACAWRASCTPCDTKFINWVWLMASCTVIAPVRRISS